jgi:energy-coupling factor transporter ATP-binding protein EcfA2
MAQLEVRDIHTSYGLSKVLFGISFEVEPGQVIALIGRNGVGKTTTMRSIICLTPPRQGKIIFEGTDITKMPTHRIARLGFFGLQKSRGDPVGTGARSGRDVDVCAPCQVTHEWAEIPRGSGAQRFSVALLI